MTSRGDDSVPRRADWGSGLIIIAFIVLCLLIAGVAGIHWKKDSRSGTLGTTIAGKETIAAFDLKAGDSIAYEYEADSPCWFIITTDWHDLDTGGKLNLSETSGKGLFECTDDGRYLLLVFFLEVPEGGEATVHYHFYKLVDSSFTLLVAKPILLVGLTAVLTTIVSATHRHTRAIGVEGKPGTIRNYWEYFASDISNWIVIPVGACLLVAASVIDATSLTWKWPDYLWSWVYDLGNYLLLLGLFFGLVITWPKYRKT